jgi:methionyl-tRNA formyltransferase
MRVIFAGTPQFAVPTLEKLIAAQHDVIAVYTQPDKPSGRGQKLTASPVKELALHHHIPVYQPKTLRDETAQQQLRELNPDLLVVVAYGLILPAAVLAIPQYGCINVHASLLPRWRGAAPIQRAIQAGDTQTGVTIMQMDEGLDTGAMLKTATCEIASNETSETLSHKLSTLGGDALLATLTELNTIKAQIQNNDLACYAKKIEKSEAEINWDLSAIEIDRLVRAFNPWPIAFTYGHNEIIRIWQTQPLAHENAAPGTIISADKHGIDVATGNGVLRLLQMQLPGSRCLSVADILNSKASWFAPSTKLGK